MRMRWFVVLGCSLCLTQSSWGDRYGSGGESGARPLGVRLALQDPAAPPSTLPAPTVPPDTGQPPRGAGQEGSVLPPITPLDPLSPLGSMPFGGSAPGSSSLTDQFAGSTGDSQSSSLLGTGDRSRLFRAPHMFGDQWLHMQLISNNPVLGDSQADVPLAGGARRLKVSEQNKAMPQNRIYGFYNHFHNAIDAETFSGARSEHVDRYTLGLEKTFCRGLCSIDLRMPFTGGYGFGDGQASLSGDEVGNLQVILKRLLISRQWLAISAGMGIDTPTGSDALIDSPLTDTRIVVRNEAVNLQPYVSLLTACQGGLFMHGFAQLDVPAGSHTAEVFDTQNNTSSSEQIDDQTLLHLDLGGGWWLVQNPWGGCVTGVAAIAEFHYTTSLEDADQAVLLTNRTAAVLRSAPGRVDLVNTTVGIHTAIGQATACRVGAAFPISEGDDRLFDSELQFSLIHGF